MAVPACRSEGNGPDIISTRAAGKPSDDVGGYQVAGLAVPAVRSLMPIIFAESLIGLHACMVVPALTDAAIFYFVYAGAGDLKVGFGKA